MFTARKLEQYCLDDLAFVYRMVGFEDKRIILNWFKQYVKLYDIYDLTDSKNLANKIKNVCEKSMESIDSLCEDGHYRHIYLAQLKNQTEEMQRLVELYKSSISRRLR